MASRIRAYLAFCALLPLTTACPGDDGAGDPTADGTGTGTDSDAVATDPDSSGGGMDTTGEPAGIGLVPCDPLAEMACEDGLCSGHPLSGFYCRPGCSTMAEPGTPCGADDVCLPVAPGAEQTACFDVVDCDPATGQGCLVAAGDSCAVVGFSPLYTACVPAGDTPSGQACMAAGMLDCGPGLGCVGADLDTGADGVCTAWCAVGEALPADCPACVEVVPGLGTCAECSLADDQCPAGSQCQLVNELLGGACVDVGPGGPGSPCAPLDPSLSCQQGLLCVPLEEQGDPICLPSCDPNNPMCPGDMDSCVDLDLLFPGAPPDQVGVCLDVGIPLCDPLAPDSCMDGENCVDIGDGLGVCGAMCDPADGAAACMGNAACLPTDGPDINVGPFVEGNGACGAACTTDAQCGGETCLHLDGLEVDGLCGTTCTPGMAGQCAMGMTCAATPEDPNVGACMTGGNPCTLGNLGECGGLACVPMEGQMLVGICLPACIGQDPVTCGGMPDQCHSKTDPIWHEGTCLDGGEPCSLIMDDCGEGQSCSLLAGGPIGGAAYNCDGEGPLVEGDDCTDDAEGCGAGVGCIGNVCRPWCDPLADACAVGTCNDVSVIFYLPPNTLGACL